MVAVQIKNVVLTNSFRKIITKWLASSGACKIFSISHHQIAIQVKKESLFVLINTAPSQMLEANYNYDTMVAWGNYKLLASTVGDNKWVLQIMLFCCICDCFTFKFRKYKSW